MAQFIDLTTVGESYHDGTNEDFTKVPWRMITINVDSIVSFRPIMNIDQNELEGSYIILKGESHKLVVYESYFWIKNQLNGSKTFDPDRRIKKIYRYDFEGKNI